MTRSDISAGHHTAIKIHLKYLIAYNQCQCAEMQTT